MFIIRNKYILLLIEHKKSHWRFDALVKAQLVTDFDVIIYIEYFCSVFTNLSIVRWHSIDIAPFLLRDQWLKQNDYINSL